MESNNNSSSEIPFLLEKSGGNEINSEEFSEFLDRSDQLRKFRQQFNIPKVKDISASTIFKGQDPQKECLYFTGNSLGLQSTKSTEMVQAAMKSWAEIGVEGWSQSHGGQVSWLSMEKEASCILAEIVGAKPIEIAVGASLTQNLNSLMLTFYQPTPQRHKILIEHNAFPSDRYAVEAQIRFRGFDPDDSLILMRPRSQEYCLRTDDILEVIRSQGDTIALVMFSGVQYYTGQFFEMEEITSAGHLKGCIVGWDLAHAAGNVPLNLHDWNVDFAVWCSYKYLNSGPGGIGCLFVHEAHAYKKLEGQRLAGWWGLDAETRFKMEDVFVPQAGAAGYVQSTTNILSLSSFLGSLQIFGQTSMTALRSKSLRLTAYLEMLIRSQIPETTVTITTPSDPQQRGCQLSLQLNRHCLDVVNRHLIDSGIVCDKRYPNCIRVAPVPLYNTFDDVRQFVEILKEILK